MSFKNNIKKAIREIMRYMPIKEKINIPVMHGELLKGRTALITGGSGGIGLEIAKLFALNEANVIIVGRDISKLEKSKKEIMSLNKNAFIDFEQLDISKVNELEKNLNSILKKINMPIDILVNNAGVLCMKDFWNMDEREFDKVINTDLKGTYFLTQIYSKYLIKNKIKGNILNISSSSSIRPAITPYHLAKNSLNAFTKGLAKELIKYGIVVNGIAPGPTATDMLLEGDENINRPSSPNGRYATPEEIANISVILVSNISNNIIGETVFVTGGCATLTYDDWN